MAITPLPTPPSRSDTPANFVTKADAFIAALPTFATEANAQAAALTLNSTTDTSSTSNSIGTGAKTFTVSSGKSFQPGMPLTIADTAAPSTNAMYGTVTSYSGTSLVTDIKSVIGSGTKTAWSISLAGAGGATLGGNVFTGLQVFKTGANIASAATINLSTATGNTVHVTGTTPISAVTMTSGQQMEVIYDSAVQLTYNATTHKLNTGGANYTTAAGDTVYYFYDGTTVYGIISSIAGYPSKLQSVTATQAAGAITTTYSGGSLDFRSATLTTGAPNSLSVASNNGVLPSGATLGSPTTISARIAVLEYYNAGSPVLGWANTSGGLQLDESNLVSPTTISAGSTSASTFYSASAVAASSPYRVIGFFDAVNTAGAWSTPTLVQGSGGQTRVLGLSTVRVNTANGFGSTNTVIRRYTTVVTNQGSDITYADSATNGATFTINANGTYGISITDSSTIATDIGISLNSAQLTTAIGTITAANRLAVGTTSAANTRATVSTSVYLSAGDVIRPHTTGNGVGSPDNTQFTITRLS